MLYYYIIFINNKILIYKLFQKVSEQGKLRYNYIQNNIGKPK